MLLTRYTQEQPRRLLQVVSGIGGIGDQVARLTAIREALRLDTKLDLRYFVPDYMFELIFAATDLQEYLINDRLEVYDIAELAEWRNDSQPGVTFTKCHVTPGRLSLIDEALITICDTTDEINGEAVYKSYVSIKSGEYKLPVESPVVVVTGYTAKSREWPVSEVNNYIGWLKSQGHPIVLLGAATLAAKSAEGVNAEGCIDLRDKTSLLEAHAIMSQAAAVVGVDNGLTHLAGTIVAEFKPALITGYTTIDPQYRRTPTARWDIRAQHEVVPPSKLDCRFCQSKFNNLFEHDFRECLYGDYQCTKSMTAWAFIEASMKAGL